MENKALILPPKYWSRSFTLIELIVVIIIVGILAAVGISQYSLIVEKSRLAEAKIRIGVMRKLAYEYYLTNGTLDGITNADVGVDYTCASTGFYRYIVGPPSDGVVSLAGVRCVSGGKTPNAWLYYYGLRFGPGVGVEYWYCIDSTGSGLCGNLPTG